MKQLKAFWRRLRLRRMYGESLALEIASGKSKTTAHVSLHGEYWGRFMAASQIGDIPFDAVLSSMLFVIIQVAADRADRDVRHEFGGEEAVITAWEAYAEALRDLDRTGDRSWVKPCYHRYCLVRELVKRTGSTLT